MDLATLTDIPLFKGIDALGLKEIVQELLMHEECFQKDEPILRAGAFTKSLDIALAG